MAHYKFEPNSYYSRKATIVFSYEFTYWQLLITLEYPTERHSVVIMVIIPFLL
jgi:hypothetical protein